MLKPERTFTWQFLKKYYFHFHHCIVDVKSHNICLFESGCRWVAIEARARAFLPLVPAAAGSPPPRHGPARAQLAGCWAQL